MKNFIKYNICIFLFTIFVINNIYATGWINENDNWRYINASGEYLVDSIKKSGEDSYYLDENGCMVKNYLLLDYDDDKYYFDIDGKMVKDTWVAVDPKMIDENDNNALAYWFYFQNNGKAFRARSEDIKKTTIDGKSYVFDSEGKLQIGFISENGSIANDDEYPYKDAIYYADINGELKKGWVKYALGTDDERHEEKEELYLYFNESNYKKVYAKQGDVFIDKTINGKKYAFDETGIMLSKWDYYDEYNKATDSAMKKFYGQESDGAMVKKGWVYTVPSEYINEKDYADDTPRYFYFDNAGEMVCGIEKRINDKYYVFDNKGIMKTGLVVFCNGKYENYIDTDYTSVEMLAKYGTYYQSEEASNKGQQTFISLYNSDYTIKYYNENGERKTGSHNIDFVDDTVTFATDNKNAYSGKKKNKYYSNGVLLKAKEDCKYGAITSEDKEARECYEWRNDGSDDYTIYYYDSSGDLHATKLLLLDKSGKKKKKGVYKDKNDNYWIVNKNNFIKNVFSIEVKEKTIGDKIVYMYKSEKDNNKFLYFNEYATDYQNYNNDSYDPSMVGDLYVNIKNDTTYQVKPDDDYILNFSLE